MLSDFTKTSPILSKLSQSLTLPVWRDWPDCQQLNALLSPDTATQSGHAIRFYPQDDTLPHPELGYEQRIAATGIVSTRPSNWHDLFNALMWLRFPRAKAAMNALHLAEIERQPDSRRSRTRDALTLLDESGVIVACTDFALVEALREHRWIEAFWTRRDAWNTQVEAFIIGHALYEKALSPYLGMTGKALMVKVGDDFFAQPLNAKFQWLDQYVADYLNACGGQFHPRELSPLPVLGVPGWYAANSDPVFYENTEYFRPKR